LSGYGDDVVYGSAGDDLLDGTFGNDTLYGGRGSDKLVGVNGDDLIFGGSGGDRISAGEQDDGLFGGGGDDDLSAYAGDDLIDGGRGADHIKAGTDRNGNADVDTFIYRGVGDSLDGAFDWITDLNGVRDTFDLWFTVAGVEAPVAIGDFAEMETALGASELAAGHAVVVHVVPAGGPEDVFLVVDGNGAAGYQAGEDLLVKITGASDPDALAAASFI
jgi:Ca2+-binding RTX toxin-like protein